MSPCLHVAIFPSWVSFPLLTRIPVMLDLGHTLLQYASSSLDYICKGPISKWGLIHRHQGLGLGHILQRDTIHSRSVPNIAPDTLLSILAHLGCYNKIPLPGWLKQQTLIPHSPRGWVAQDQGTSIVNIWERLTSWFIASLLCVCLWWKGPGSSLGSLL